jgi:hypothetical protein
MGANLSTPTSLVLYDVRAEAGSVQLPPPIENLGRIITFVDQYKACSSESTFTINTTDLFYRFSTVSYIVDKPGKTVEVISVNSSPPKWMVSNDDSSDSLTGQILSTTLLSTNTLYVSTLLAPVQSQQQTITFS